MERFLPGGFQYLLRHTYVPYFLCQVVQSYGMVRVMY
jgi:hypothetical protein